MNASITVTVSNLFKSKELTCEHYLTGAMADERVHKRVQGWWEGVIIIGKADNRIVV